MKNIVMRVGDNYRTNYDLNTMRECADFDNMAIVQPESRCIGYLAEPPIQGSGYKPYYSSGAVDQSLLKATVNDLNEYVNHDEYSQDFERIYGRKPKKSECLVYIGEKDNPRLVVMKVGDYHKWANNITPIDVNNPLLSDIARTNPYRIIIGDDGVRVKDLVLNPSSSTTAYCTNCHKLHIIRVLPAEGARLVERDDRENHFCCDKCRMAYKSTLHPRFQKNDENQNKD